MKRPEVVKKMVETRRRNGSYVASDKQKQVARETMKGNKFCLGKHWKLTEVTKNKQRKSKIGKKNPNYNNHSSHTKEWNKKISMANTGKKASEETKRKIATAKTKDWNSLHKLKLTAPPKKDRCDICNTPESELKRKLHYDHDHKTGKFRGWLCMSCNLGLGHAKDNIEILLAMVEYLKKSKDGI